ncbi:helix-turn-helix transcriptional regulator [Desulfitibacter alkalitolerans]|uniref:helix-turn-helix transcriptional regulator n=1 Tax=Desulfitibacter alkalitolerans TaxID=264641 RepID=UPI0005527176|nr:helix-turn-helix transcriptional regulator [Desulfitibacter alkalitolerans]
MLSAIKLPEEMLDALRVIYKKSKKYNPELTEEDFISIIVGQWLETYKAKNEQRSLTKDNLSLRNELKEAIKISGKSQRQIAKETGISHVYISQLTKEEYDPSVKVAFLIMKSIGYPLHMINKLFYLVPRQEE